MTCKSKANIKGKIMENTVSQVAVANFRILS